MDFVRSYVFTNATLTSCPLFFILSSLLGGFAVALLLHPPNSDEKNEKKWATGQSCIRKDVTSFKIHTLAPALKGNEVSDYCTRTPISTVEFIVQLQFRFYLSIMTFQLDFLATCCGAIVTNSPPIFYYGPVCCYG